MLYMVTFTINIPPMLAYIPYMDPMGIRHGYFPGSITEGKGTRSKLSAARKPQVQSVYVNAMCESPEDKKILRFFRDL